MLKKTMRLPVPAILLLLFLAVIFPVHIKAEPAPDAPVIVEAVRMLRLYNPNSGEHFYTSDEEESRFLIQLGWYDEGTGWLAPLHSDTPVYRLYNPNAGDHHYTTSKEERDHLVSVGWNDEGIGWYSAGQGGTPVLRQYNPNARSGAHNFTVSKGENDYLASIGWKEEGTGWYGLGKKDLAILPESLTPSVRIVDPLREEFRPEELHLETFNRNGENMIVGSYTNTTGSDVSFACIATEWRSVHQYAYDGEVLGYQPWLKAGETFYFAESIDDWSGPCILSVQTRKPKPENYEGFSEELSRREDGSFTFTVDFAFGPSVPNGCGHASIVLLFYDENDTLVWVDKHTCRDPGTYTFDAPPCEYASYRSTCSLEAIIYLASTIDFF